jgi:hydrogenase/urease accessory protein HupE
MRRFTAISSVLSSLLAVLVASLWSVGVGAHEIGTTRVVATFSSDRSYAIDVVTDAAALVEKLEASAGLQSSDRIEADRLQPALVRFDDEFRQRVTIGFDAADVRPAVSYAVEKGSEPGSAAVAIIRLTGTMPSGARRFTWSYGWTFASYALTIRRDGAAEPATEWLEGGQASAPFALMTAASRTTRVAIAMRYLALGFTHILPKGLDHMLFVLGIYLLSGRARSVLAQVSAFTIAHSITLALSLYGVISVPPRVVEPMIALSIVYVAVENIFRSELRSWRVALVFAFGLLHGMGFAGALRELGLPRSEFVTALVTFNVGVEAGQLAVIAAAFLAVGWQCSHRAWYRARVVVPASTLIACVAVYWTIERLVF